jgi:hypothetical protein
MVPLAPGGSDRFRDLSQRLPPLLDALRSAAPIVRGIGAIPATPGIYLLSDEDVPVYVGQTPGRGQKTLLAKKT